jgi:UDP-glucose 4-epimerase
VRVLVTGAAGYVGRAVVNRLSEAGHDVVALVRSTPTPPLPCEIQVGDLLNAASLVPAVREADAVCHLAAQTRVRESFECPVAYFQTNVTGTLNLLDVLAAERDRTGRASSVVLASTGAVYGVPEQQPIREDIPPQPLNPYGASKLAAEEAVRWQAATGAIGAVILRTFNVSGAINGFSDPDETRIIPRALAVAAGTADQLGVNGDGTAIRDYVHVDDLARAFAAAIDACRPGNTDVYNVGSGKGASIRDVIDAVERSTGRSVSVHWGPPKPEPAVLLGDVTAIHTALGWTARRSDLDSIVADSWAALRAK